MVNFIVIFPVLIPFAVGLLLLWQRENRAWQNTLSVLAGLGQLVVSGLLLRAVWHEGVLVFHLGNWPAPFGIVFACDMLSAVMVCICALVGLSGMLFAVFDMGNEYRRGAFFSLFYFLLFGINGAFLTGDLFNLFVFFEVLLMTSYVLLVLGNKQAQVNAGLRYLTLNLIGSTLFLAGAGILYCQLGTLNMADIAQRISGIDNKGLVTAVGMLFFCVFGIKSAMVPLHMWLPDAYSAPRAAVGAVFAGLMTKVGVYSFYRLFGTVFCFDTVFTHGTVLLPLAGLTMVVGVWGAVVQYDVRRILAFHSISQIGYILMGLSLWSPLALAGGIFHMIHHSLVKSSLFLIGGGIGRIAGSEDLRKIGGLAKFSGLALLFLVSALALAGVPPLSGFFSKFVLVVSAFQGGHPALIGAALLTSLLTLYSMMKIWRMGFWGARKEEKNEERAEGTGLMKGIFWACGFSVVLVVLLSVLAGPVMKICIRAGEQILDQKAYVSAVLENSRTGGGGKPRPLKEKPNPKGITP